MKKVFLAISLLISFVDCYSHAWTISRRWCMPWAQRFVAEVSVENSYRVLAKKEKVKELIRIDYKQKWDAKCQCTKIQAYPVYKTYYVTVPQWQKICGQVDKGCTRPRSVYQECCVPHAGCAGGEARVNFNGRFVRTWTNSPFLRAGTSLPFTINESVLDNINKEGYSKSEVSCNAEISESNTLQITNLKGKLEIAKNSNFLSNYKMYVIREKSIESEANTLENQLRNGTLDLSKVVAYGEVSLSKNGVFKSGLFENVDLTTILNSDDKTEIEVNKDLIETQLNNIYLDENEDLTVVTISDSQFDFSLVKFETSSENESMINVYPNPASNMLNIDFNSLYTNLKVDILDLNSNEIFNIYNGTCELGLISKSFTINDLNSGLYKIIITQNNQIQFVRSFNINK